MSVRLAALVAVGFLTFDVIRPFVFEWVFDRFAIPESITLKGQEFLFLPHLSAEMVGEELLAGSLQDAEGRWHPTEQAKEDVCSKLHTRREGILWLDRDLMVMEASEGLAWSRGDRWNPDDVPSDFDEWYFHHEPVHRESRLAGWLVLLFRPPPPVATFGRAFEEAVPWSDRASGGPQFEIPDEIRRVERRMWLLAFATSWASTILIALLLGVVISRFVTKRLTRLAAMIGRPVQETPGLAEPLRVGGADEITMLARALDESRRRVSELVGALDERDVRRREWIAQVSHDLRTPLTALIACLERARPVVAHLSAAKERADMTDILSVALQDAERVRVLAGDLLEIARLDAHAELHLESVLPAELVERAATGLAPLGATKGVEIEILTPAPLPSLHADGSRLLRVLENLLRNALHAARAKVVVEVRPEEDGLRFEVRDDGAGFAGATGPVDLDALSPSRPPDDSSSTGLGLTVARRIIDAHSGTFGAENRAPHGATVWFHVPVSDVPQD